MTAQQSALDFSKEKRTDRLKALKKTIHLVWWIVFF